jgi:hypothetical protein
VDAPLSGAGVGLARRGPPGPGAGSGQESGDNRLTRLVTCQLSVHASQTKRSHDFIGHLEQSTTRSVLNQDGQIKPVVLVYVSTTLTE